jgi:aryl-alcohol dehydrogenase-like predicted oxidoreductase
MRYRLFGRSGLRVSELCLGTMTFGNDWSPTMGADAAESRAIFDAFAEAGGNFIDTANVYSYKSTTGEELVGDFIRADRDHFVVSTKYGVSMGTDLSRSGNSRKNMMRCVEESLKRLKSDYIDIYWLHVWEESTPLEEILRGFDDLVSSGKVHYIAVSDTPAWQISRAVMLAELRGWSRFCGIEVEYNLLERTAERELLPMARELGLAVCAWAPLAGGKLSGKYADGSSNAGRFSPDMVISDRERTITRLVVEIAAELGCRPTQVALSAIRQMGRRNSVIPILGARTVDQIQNNLGCLNITLTDEHLRRLDEASAIDPGFPHAMRTIVRALAYSGKAELLDGLS